MSGKIDEGACHECGETRWTYSPPDGWICDNCYPPCDCPKCNKKLEWDWIWAGDFDTSVIHERDDYQSWFMVCEDCATNFNLVENKPVEITE